jgi:hypothetical protein
MALESVETIHLRLLQSFGYFLNCLRFETLLGKTKILNASIDQNGLPNVTQIDYDNKMIPKEVVSNLRNYSGTYESGEICKIDDFSKPLIINASLELSGLNVDLSGKRIRFNVSCGKEFIVKQSALQVWREGTLSIKEIKMSFSSKDQNVVVAECSITNELPKIKKAKLILGKYSKTVDLENGKALLKMNQTELTLQGQNINGKNVICKMQQKLVHQFSKFFYLKLIFRKMEK